MTDLQQHRVRTPYSAVLCVRWTLKWEIAKPAQPEMVCLYGSDDACPQTELRSDSVILTLHRPPTDQLSKEKHQRAKRS